VNIWQGTTLGKKHLICEVTMTDLDLVSLYNYDEFVPKKYERWSNFQASPPLGGPAPDFPLWHLDGHETRLSEIWLQHALSIIEFGSFT
jgi:hypothetical protein